MKRTLKITAVLIITLLSLYACNEAPSQPSKNYTHKHQAAGSTLPCIGDSTFSVTIGANETVEFQTCGISGLVIQGYGQQFGVSTQSGAFDFHANYVRVFGVGLIDFSITNNTQIKNTYTITTVAIQ
jgi:hypothetical protein